MHHELRITPDPIDLAALALARRASPAMGAVVTFVGLVRDREAGQPIAALEYEAFQRMAEHQFERLFAGLERWPLESVRLVHRVGVVPANQPALWVEVVAPHRAEAFAACQWLLDAMKEVVPIWKKPVPPASTENGHG